MNNIPAPGGSTAPPRAPESNSRGASASDTAPAGRSLPAIGHPDIQARAASSTAGEAWSPGNRMAPRIPLDVSQGRDVLHARGYHSLLMKAYASGTAPTKMYDGQFLRDLVKAENARHAGLGLSVCSVGVVNSLKEFVIGDAMKQALLDPGKSHQAVLTDDATHAAAMSLRVLGDPAPTTLSVIVIDSVKTVEHSDVVKLHRSLRSELEKATADDALKALRIQITTLPLGIQVNEEGCNIFALVAAKKAATSQGVQDLHEWAHDMVGRGAPGISALAAPLEPAALIEPTFFKHAMKRGVIEKAMEAREEFGLPNDEPVNKRGETLLQRFEKFDRATVVEKKSGPLHTRYSRSYEEKRLEKLARLIEYKLDRPADGNRVGAAAAPGKDA